MSRPGGSIQSIRYGPLVGYMLRLGVLPEGYIYPQTERPVRDLLRKRSQLVHQRTSNLQSVQNLMARNRGHSLSANRIKRLTFLFLRLCAMPFRDMGNGTGNVRGFDLQTQASGLRTPDP